MVTCNDQIEELRRASRYPKFRGILQPHLVGLMLNHLHRAQVLEHPPGKHEADDPRDTYLLNLADAVRADYLITGDKRAGILKRKRIGKSRILTTAAFCEELKV